MICSSVLSVYLNAHSARCSVFSVLHFVLVPYHSVLALCPPSHSIHLSAESILPYAWPTHFHEHQMTFTEPWPFPPKCYPVPIARAYHLWQHVYIVYHAFYDDISQTWKFQVSKKGALLRLLSLEYSKLHQRRLPLLLWVNLEEPVE